AEVLLEAVGAGRGRVVERLVATAEEVERQTDGDLVTRGLAGGAGGGLRAGRRGSGLLRRRGRRRRGGVGGIVVVATAGGETERCDEGCRKNALGLFHVWAPSGFSCVHVGGPRLPEPNCPHGTRDRHIRTARTRRTGRWCGH